MPCAIDTCTAGANEKSVSFIGIFVQIHFTQQIFLLFCSGFVETTMQNTVENIAKTHYENFPVGSFLVPKQFREEIKLIYTFARVADDLADEGTMKPDERIERIDDWQKQLHNAIRGKNSDKFFTKLAKAIQKHNLSLQLLDDLIVAFRKDAENPQYETFDELLEYCRYSANPIGRLMLQIFECSNEKTNRYSNYICTALQLSNFWQDISVDTRRNRFYIPQSELRHFGLQNSDLRSLDKKEIFRALMKTQVDRTRSLFEDGKPLLTMIAKEFRFELKLTWHGGMRILEKIETMNYDTRAHRPALTKFDKILITFRALKEF